MLFYNIKQHFKLLNPAINYHVTSLSHQYHLPQNKFFLNLYYYIIINLITFAVQWVNPNLFVFRQKEEDPVVLMNNEPIKGRSSIGVNEISGRWPRDKALCRAENAGKSRPSLIPDIGINSTIKHSAGPVHKVIAIAPRALQRADL